MRISLQKSVAKPFVKWAGGKGQLLKVIEKFYPEQLVNGNIKRYIEPFVGGGALLFEIIQNFNSIEEFFIFDINSDLINSYMVIKHNINELIDYLKELETEFIPADREKRSEMYYDLRAQYNSSMQDVEIDEKNMSVKRAGQFIFLNRTCFNGLYRVNKSGQFNVPMGDYKNPTICDEDNLYYLNEILKRVEIFNKNYQDSYQFVEKETFVYFDPPYRPLNISSSFTSYSKFDFDDLQQKELANYYTELHNKGASLMLSNSDPKNIDENDDFFDVLYDGFRINRVYATRMINSDVNKRGKITELLITNN